MKKSFGVKNWMFPMPVLIVGTYNDDGTTNMMNAAWSGIMLEDQITICIDTSAFRGTAPQKALKEN